MSRPKRLSTASRFIEGMGRALDIGATRSKDSATRNDRDVCRSAMEALRSDWQKIGNDMRSAIDKVAKRNDVE